MSITIVGNLVSVIPIEYADQHGAPIPPPTGDTITIQNSNGAAIEAYVEEDGNNNRSLILTPIQPAQAAASADITVTDTLAHGKTLTASDTFTIEAAAAPDANSMRLRTDMMTTRPLPTRGGARVIISR